VDLTGAVLVGLLAVAYALAASRLERRSVGGPLVFTAAGLALGPSGLSLIDLPASSETVKLVTELTLALLLFADASTVGFRQLRKHAGLPLRLLAIGLPLTIALGTVLAHSVLTAATWAVAALAATILAPTDAALSLPVVSNPHVPLTIRTSLNVESGLNDGIASPVVTVLLAVVAVEESAAQGWLPQAIAGIAVALAVATALGAGGGWLVIRARLRGMTTPLSEQLVVLVLALVSYVGAVELGGNGFVASFVAGLGFGALTRHQLAGATEYTENSGLFLSYAVWVLFGAVLVGPLLQGGWHGAALGYAVLSLTVVRMVPVALALIGTRLDWASVLFLGWFGPRGLASVVFFIIATDELHLGRDDATSVVAETVVWTILLSVVLHGLSAGPFSARFGRHTRLAEGAGSSGATAQDTGESAGRRRLGITSLDPQGP